MNNNTVKYIKKFLYVVLNFLLNCFLKPLHLLLKPVFKISHRFPAPTQRAWYKLHSHYLRFYGFPLGKPFVPETDNVIIFLPQMSWNNNMTQRPHHLPRAFARAGWTSVFITQDAENDNVIGIKKIDTGLYLCSRVRLLRKIKNPWIYMNYTVNMYYLKYFKEFRFIYDYVDKLEIHTFFTKKMYEEHNRSLKIAKVVTATSDFLLDGIIKIRPDAILVPNAVFPDDFTLKNGAGIPPDMACITEQKKPIVGYYGIFSRWKIDYALIHYAADHLPDYNFVLIGMDYDHSIQEYNWKKFPNIYLLGKKNYPELPAYAHCFDIALLPFLINDATKAISPVKLFEFFAMNLPVVSTDVPEIRKYKPVLIARDPNDLIQHIREAFRLKNDPAYLSAVQKELALNTWDYRCETIIKQINKTQ